MKLGWIGGGDGGGMACMLAYGIGPSNAATMLMGSDPVTAGQALQWNLVSELHPRELLLARGLHRTAGDGHTVQA